jgi:hypothetical protein
MICEKLEIKFYDDGTGNLNFWDWAHGNDVVVEITTDGRLMKSEFILNDSGKIAEDENGDAMKTEPVEISFKEYMNLVKDSVSKRTV